MFFEAAAVISKRLRKISRGGLGAVAETNRMMAEKIIAAAEAGIILSTGGGLKKVAKNYRKRVRANNRRLK